MLPAPAQGALAVECRTADVDLEQLLASTLDDKGTRAAVTAERALLAALEAGCSAPVGALAEIVEDFDAEGKVVERISLRGTAAAEGENGAVDMVRASALAEQDQAAQLGKDLAAELLDLGAGALSDPAE
jgi:hydroxymethylbilane synthase